MKWPVLVKLVGMSQAFMPRDIVVVPKGYVGIINEIDRRKGRAKVQLGAAGPFPWIPLTQLRWATRRQAREECLDYLGTVFL